MNAPATCAAADLDPFALTIDDGWGSCAEARMKGSGTHAVLSATLTVAAAAVLTFVDISHAAQAVIRVPQDQPTIQDGIDAAPPGGVVVVAPGTYVENIEIIGKPLTVRSEAGRDATIIDGGQAGVVVSIGATSGKQVLRGFTITNGSEGGIRTGDGAPVIERNLITRNTYCGEGGGITAAFSDAIIRKNIISHNHQAGCSGGPGGGGIIVRGAGEAQVLNNQIIGNSHGSFGGGISLFSAGTPVISGNLIRDNRAGQGGGFWIVNDSDALIVNNIIAENVAGGEGGGVYWLVPSGSTGPTLVNNTIAANMAVRGSAVFADGFDVDARIFNNLLVGAGTAAVLYCGGFNDPNPPQIFFNDVWNASSGPRYGGICSDLTGSAGNISVDPMLKRSFHLRPTSPVVDKGTNSGSPTRDFNGTPRPLDGDGDGSAVVDMGADELPPPS